MENERKLDPERICRICLQEKMDLFLIFDEMYLEAGATLSQILNECTKYKVERFDEFPQNICESCMTAARAAYQFKRQTEESYRMLYDMLDLKLRVEKVEIIRTNREFRENFTQTDKSTIYPCELCGKVFTEYTYLTEHRLSQHRGAAKKCKFCGAVFKRLRQLKGHLESEHNVRAVDIKCPICSKQFTRKDHMKRHMRNIHKQEYFSNRTYLLETRADINSDVENNFETSDFPKNSTYWPHISADESENEDASSEEEKHKITNLDDKGTLDETAKSAYNDTDAATDDNSGTYSCELCCTEFDDRKKLISHQLEKHQGNAKRCIFCQKEFSSLRNLQCHLTEEHGQPTPNIKCPVCLIPFPRKDRLKKHMQKVHNLEMNSSRNMLEEPEIDIKIVEQQIDSTNFTTNSTYWPNISGDESDNGNGDHDATNFLTSDEEGDTTLNMNESVASFVETELNIKVEKPDDDKSVNEFATPPDLKSFNEEVEKMNLSDIQVKKEKCEDDAAVVQTTPRKLKVEIIREYLQGENKKRRHRGKSKQPIEDEKNECPTCQRSFTRHCHLLRHMLLHSDEKAHACSFCDKRFARRDHLKTHETYVHGDKTFKCDQCDCAFVRNEALTRHIDAKHGDAPNAHKIHSCEYCSKKFATKSYLRKHVLNHTDRKFACQHCEETFRERKALREHERIHGAHKNFLCSMCGESFVRNDYLRVHMRRHTGEKPYKCQYCEKGFPRATDLKVHERYHTGHKPNLCTLCGKGFHRAYNLTIHMRTHTGERPFKCDHCPKSFAQSNDLKAHVRRHTGERFKCNNCDASFLQLYGLRQHCAAIHNIHIAPTSGRLQKFPPITPAAPMPVIVNEPQLPHTPSFQEQHPQPHPETQQLENLQPQNLQPQLSLPLQPEIHLQPANVLANAIAMGLALPPTV